MRTLCLLILIFTSSNLLAKTDWTRTNSCEYKNFDNSALIGDWINISDFHDINNINFCLKVNNEIVQISNSSNMIWKVDELISEVSNYFTLKIGDILFTGTPEGVGKVNIGDVLDGYLEEKKVFSIKIK